MHSDEIPDLSDQEANRIVALEEARASRLEAEADLERQRKFRVLFERASESALPFIVYVIYVGALSVGTVFRIAQFSGPKFWGLSLTLLVAALAPLWLLRRDVRRPPSDPEEPVP